MVLHLYLNMVQQLSIMEQAITHTRIYGHGAADVLKQAEIKAKVIDSGSMSILLSATQELIIVAAKSETGNAILKYQLVSKLPLY